MENSLPQSVFEIKGCGKNSVTQTLFLSRQWQGWRLVLLRFVYCSSVAHFRCCARISNFLQTNCKFFAWNAKYRQSSVNSNFLHQIYCFHPIFEIHEDWKSHGDKSRLWGGCYKTSQFILPSGSWTVFATWDWGLSWDEWHHCCWHTSILRSLHFGQCWC